MRAAAAAFALLALTAAGCSKPDADRLKHDTQAVGHDMAVDVKKAADDPNLKKAGDELKQAAHDTGRDLKKAGDSVSEHTHDAAQDTKNAVNKDD
jgi:hypothetical protein